MLEVKEVVGVSQANNRFRQRILIANCMHNSNVVFVLHMLNALLFCASVLAHWCCISASK